jgi:serine/threonine-protein kinase
MGTYYRARHPKLDRFAALKMLPVDPATDAGLIESFKKEAKAMARLNHTNIIGIYEFIERESALYLLMEFVEGDILERLANTRHFNLSEILAIITQVCAALRHAHENGVIHRDLRPGNTMLDQNGLVKVGDFGLARLMGEELFRRRMTEANLAMGTMDYVAPEQLEAGLPVDHRADIYSVGMMIYKLLTRVLPRGTFVVPSKHVPNLDPLIDDLVVRCLQRNPDNRFQRVTDLWVEVNSLLQEPPQAPPKKGPTFHFRTD